MTDAMRDMIAELMGSQKEDEDGRDLPPYNHPSVCKAFLVGSCPYELVPDSRLQNMLSCRKTHEPAHKADFQKAQQKRDHFYDIDAYEALESAVKIVDAEIARIKVKLDREAKEQTDSAEQLKTQKLIELDAKISKTVEEMEALGNLGKVDESMKMAKTLEELRNKKSELEASTEVRVAGPGSNASRLRVCEDCGAQLNIMDHESRIADHYGGKMHLGMIEVREKYNTQQLTIEERRTLKREQYGTTSPLPPSRFERKRSPHRDRRDDNRYNRRRSRSRSNDRDRRDRDRSGKDRDRGGRDNRKDRDRRDRRY